MDNANAKYVVKIGRNLNLENSRELKKDLSAALERGVRHIELDFAGTEFIDSSGLGKLLLFNEKFTEQGGSFRIKNVVHPAVLELFQVINLERFITVEYKK